ncbi:hypothetical protein ULMS_14200 [Patiriisocius marinistellae]|uniref:DUF4331 domain-containing protein n=1 Tax=Patiriisocius marinistellae TaxID=2494560 RepID=A0A5J4FXL8_9FLAO|nr:DUF4331 family protein [Patiriisocius marinistellae]GEQ85912.1 hypothetical protein ULMS_14200 [Patiriisocius marinistellae]
MNTYKLRILFVAVCTSLMFVQCGNDDDNILIIEDDEPVAVDFSGTWSQEDSMGRPGINTVFSGSDAVKNDFNSRIPTDRASFQPIFQETLEFYHDVYAMSLNIPVEDLDYEENILGLDAPTFTTVLAQFDALQVAPEGETIYFNPATGLALTGRKLTDDVIDVSLTLMFGGMSGTRFDGNNGTPQLTSDGVGVGDRTFGSFPYLNTPN